MNTLLIISLNNEHVYIPADVWHLLERKSDEWKIVSDGRGATMKEDLYEILKTKETIKAWAELESVKIEANTYYERLNKRKEIVDVIKEYSQEIVTSTWVGKAVCNERFYELADAIIDARASDHKCKCAEPLHNDGIAMGRAVDTRATCKRCGRIVLEIRNENSEPTNY